MADVELDAGEVRLCLGSEAVPIVPPFSTVLLDHIATRSNQTTATNPASTLLFPGRRAGQPIHPGSYQICPSRSVMNITVSLFTELGPSQLATTVRRSALVRTARGERWALAAAQ